MNKLFYLTLLFSILISSILMFNGIKWGRPQNMDSLIFKSKVEKKILLKPMVEIYQSIWEERNFYEDKYKVYNPEDHILIWNKKKVKKAIISCCRTYLLRSYGLDEEVPFNVLKNIDISKRKFNPEYFGYGNLYIFTFGAFVYTGKILKVFNLGNVEYYLKNYNEMSKVYLWGRLFNILFFILCILLFAFFIKNSTEKNITHYHLLTIFLFSVFPPFIMWAHFVSPFIFGLFFGILSLISIIKIFDRNDDSRYFLISAFIIGLSSGILMSYLLLFPFLFFLLLFYKKRFSLYLLVILFFFIGFLVANPYILTSFNTFLNELRLYSTSSEYSSLKISNVFDYFSQTLRIAFGILPLFVIFITSLLGILISTKKEIIRYIFLIYIILVYSLKFPLFVRHNFIVYVFFIFIFLYSCLHLSKKIPGIKRILLIIFSLFALNMFFYGLAVSNNFNGTNVRTMASNFINENISEGTELGFIQYPSPWRIPPFHFLHYNIVIDKNLNKNPEYFIISKIEDPEGKVLRKISGKYKLLVKFSKPIKIKKYHLLKFNFKNRDWMRVNPEIYIFKRIKRK